MSSASNRNDEPLADELANSRQRCSRELEQPCRTATLSPGPLDALCWPRAGIYSIDGALRFRVKSSATLMALRGTPVAQALERGWRIPRRRRH